MANSIRTFSETACHPAIIFIDIPSKAGIEDHKLVPISILGVTDPDGDPVTLTITKITQDEPVLGTGSGNTAPDGIGVGTATASVRAERAGSQHSRVYEISFTASDGKGGECIGSVLVAVPHDQSPNTTIVDDGQIYDSPATREDEAFRFLWRFPLKSTAFAAAHGGASHLSVNFIPSTAPKTSCISVPMLYPNCLLEL